MRLFLAVSLMAFLASCNMTSGVSADDLPKTGQYRWTKKSIYSDGTSEPGRSGTGHEVIADTQGFTDRILNPADNCHDASTSLSGSKILITATCREMGIELPTTITGKYGKDFWEFRVEMDGPNGKLIEEMRSERTGD